MIGETDVEKWVEIHKGVIPFGDYSLDAYIDDHNTLTIFYIGHQKFRIILKNVIGFKIIDEGSELRDFYAEIGLAANRPLLLDNYIYEVQNVEFGDLVEEAMCADESKVSLRHYKLVSANFLIDVTSQSDIQVKLLN